jgi:hypothetical protein
VRSVAELLADDAYAALRGIGLFTGTVHLGERSVPSHT